MKKTLTRLLALILAALTLATSAPAETTIDLSASASSAGAVMGSGAVLTGLELFMSAASATEGMTSLLRFPVDGSAPFLVDSAPELTELTPLNDNLYYLKRADQRWCLCVRKSDGARSTVYEFADGATVGNLCAKGNDLLLLVNNQMHIVYPESGVCVRLVGAQMSEFVVVDNFAYYVAMSDTMVYESKSLINESNAVTVQSGCLYRLNLTTGSPELVLKAGIKDLTYQSGMLYFHNLSDNYIMGTGDSEWLEGHLYSYDLATSALTNLVSDYDWGYYPADGSVMVYTSQSLRLLGQRTGVLVTAASEDKVLYTPETYAVLAGIDGGVAVYEPTLQKMTLVYPNDVPTMLYAGDMTNVQTEVAGNLNSEGDAGAEGWFSDGTAAAGSDTTTGAGTLSGEDETTSGSSSSGSSSSSTKTTTTSKGTDSSWFFKDSYKRKLTVAEIKAIGAANYGYARNEIYARHGYVFKKSKYKEYFAKKSWYTPGGFSTGDLNAIEWYNMELIKSLENGSSGSGSSSGGSGSSGSGKYNYVLCSYSSSRKMTDAEIRALGSAKWGYARNEIYARHGYVFKTAKYKNYFSQQSWYKAGGFSTGDLNSADWYNMKRIKIFEDGKLK